MSRTWRALGQGAVLPGLLLLGACRGPSGTGPAAADPGLRTVQAFFEAYRQRDLDGLMRCLAADATFQGTGGTLDRAQIRAFFQRTFQDHPDLQVEAGAPERAGNAVRVRVRVQAGSASVQTWVFELAGPLIRTYRLELAAR
ncbi:MAG TPA: nuclear transport factor 2 family protein [Holophagaceae bacterium]